MREIYYVMSVDNSRLAPVANPREPRQYALASLLAAALLGVGLLSAHGRLESLEYGYRVERLQREKQQLVEANRKLRLEEAALGDPLRIDWIARNQLGMTTLAPHQIFPGEPAAPATAVVAQNARWLKHLSEPASSLAAAIP